VIASDSGPKKRGGADQDETPNGRKLRARGRHSDFKEELEGKYMRDSEGYCQEEIGVEGVVVFPEESA